MGAVNSNENSSAHTSGMFLTTGRCLNVRFSKNLHTLGNAIRLIIMHFPLKKKFVNHLFFLFLFFLFFRSINTNKGKKDDVCSIISALKW